MGHRLYCLAPTAGSDGLAHVFPEAVLQNEFTLPPGAVCSPCNHDLGHELDSMLPEYPAIAIFIQFFALIGKEGRPRERLGGICLSSQQAGRSDLQMTATEVKAHTDEAGKRVVDWVVSPTRAFKMKRFRRALHHVAFNALAYQDGVPPALSAQFNRIRQYVRAPGRHEAWSYAEQTIAPQDVPRVGVRWIHTDRQRFALLDVGLTTFAVGLHVEQDFGDLVERQRFAVVDPTIEMPDPAGLRYIESDTDALSGQDDR